MSLHSTSLHRFCLAGVLSVVAVAAQARPVNNWLANSPWPVSHQHPYAQAASPHAGPASNWALGSPQFVDTGLINITLAMSPLYPNGNRVYWGSNPAGVYKVAVVNGALTKLAALAKPGSALGNIATPTSGAYTMVDFENTFYTVQGTTLLAYREATPGQMSSPIVLARQVTIPATLADSDDAIVGMNMLWDGNIAFATREGTVGVIRRGFTQVQGLKLGAGDEEVSNSIATDENGGIYVVSSKAMYRVQWTGSEVSLAETTGAWRAEYNAGTAGAGGGRLGAGSGSTPTLMGSGTQKFVVITDGADVANLVLFWRDGIPADWQPVAAGKSRRIAGEIPVNFGNANRTQTKSEQSVLVSGYGAVVVSNDYRNVDLLSGSIGLPLIDQMLNGLIVFNSGSPLHQPWGVQKFVWDTAARRLKSAWVRNDVSCPNAIPVMSESANRFYCVGAHLGSWTIESLDWTSGGGHFRKYVGVLPRWNSFYASTQLTGDGGVIYGTYNGVAYVPKRW
ncbi:MAG: hypothetical protein K0S46_1709 [Moraxellaceae bacterium]|jgi:hypothetical protein|nr:hypothetical protein [Moraxellaceae bacterium]